jgi:putative two-component system response regulator
MQRHPLIGAGILEPLRLGRLVSPIVRGHHERWDGRGYPDGLAREEIPLGARIVSVVDAFDAMTHDRPYRKALSLDEAREELVRCAGAQFDPELVELLLTSEVAPARPEATLVRGLYASVRAELVS